MRVVEIRLDEVKDKEGLHYLLKKRLDLPDYYGNNLDALWDCLMEIREETELRFYDFEALKELLEQYADKMYITLEQACEENPCLKVSFA